MGKPSSQFLGSFQFSHHILIFNQAPPTLVNIVQCPALPYLPILALPPAASLPIISMKEEHNPITRS